MTQSPLEREFETRRLQLLGDLPDPIREYKFAKGRKNRIDFYWAETKVGVEMEGVFVKRGHKSRHTTPMGYTKDCTKYNLAAEMGITILRYTIWHLRNDPVTMFAQIRRVIERTNDDQ